MSEELSKKKCIYCEAMTERVRYLEGENEAARQYLSQLMRELHAERDKDPVVVDPVKVISRGWLMLLVVMVGIQAALILGTLATLNKAW